MGPRITNVITLYRFPGDPLPSLSCSERVRVVLGSWRASEASETLSRVYNFRADAMHIYMYGGPCAIIVAHATYT